MLDGFFLLHNCLIRDCTNLKYYLLLYILPDGCRAGRRKRKRRSCELVWRSYWEVRCSSPRSSWRGSGGLAGSVGGETWWALVGSVDLPQHWDLQIWSIPRQSQAHCFLFIWKTKVRKFDYCIYLLPPSSAYAYTRQRALMFTLNIPWGKWYKSIW